MTREDFLKALKGIGKDIREVEIWCWLLCFGMAAIIASAKLNIGWGVFVGLAISGLSVAASASQKARREICRRIDEIDGLLVRARKMIGEELKRLPLEFLDADSGYIADLSRAIDGLSIEQRSLREKIGNRKGILKMMHDLPFLPVASEADIEMFSVPFSELDAVVTEVEIRRSIEAEIPGLMEKVRETLPISDNADTVLGVLLKKASDSRQTDPYFSKVILLGMLGIKEELSGNGDDEADSGISIDEYPKMILQMFGDDSGDRKTAIGCFLNLIIDIEAGKAEVAGLYRIILERVIKDAERRKALKEFDEAFDA